MTLQKCHLSLPCPELLEKSLETRYGITEPNSHCQSSAAALTYRETVRNKKLEAFNGASKDFFS